MHLFLSFHNGESIRFKKIIITKQKNLRLVTYIVFDLAGTKKTVFHCFMWKQTISTAASFRSTAFACTYVFVFVIWELISRNWCSVRLRLLFFFFTCIIYNPPCCVASMRLVLEKAYIKGKKRKRVIIMG